MQTQSATGIHILDLNMEPGTAQNVYGSCRKICKLREGPISLFNWKNKNMKWLTLSFKEIYLKYKEKTEVCILHHFKH